MDTVVGGADDPDELVREALENGSIPRNLYFQAVRYWRRNLLNGVRAPDGRTIKLTLTDLHHILLGDQRFLRVPIRLRYAITNIYETRAGRNNRRVAFTRWIEQEHTLVGVFVLEPGGTIRSMHIVNDERIERYRRDNREVLWQRR